MHVRCQLVASNVEGTRSASKQARWVCRVIIYIQDDMWRVWTSLAHLLPRSQTPDPPHYWWPRQRWGKEQLIYLEVIAEYRRGETTGGGESSLRWTEDIKDETTERRRKYFSLFQTPNTYWCSILKKCRSNMSTNTVAQLVEIRGLPWVLGLRQSRG
jgi:hypothetical protein